MTHSKKKNECGKNKEKKVVTKHNKGDKIDKRINLDIIIKSFIIINLKMLSILQNQPMVETFFSERDGQNVLCSKIHVFCLLRRDWHRAKTRRLLAP